MLRSARPWVLPAKIAIIQSSTYGHVSTLASAIEKAIKATGASADMFLFPEILSDEVLAKMHAAPKPDYPVITPDLLKEYDGFLFGFPTRYGRANAAVSAFFDQTGGLWFSGALVGKFAGIFTSSASQHGGQESTALTTIPFLAHHGISFVPIGFGAKELADNSEIVGGSAYGASAIASGDGSRAVTEKELVVAAYQGTSFANLLNTFVAGKTALAKKAETAEPAAAAAPVATEAAAPVEADSTKTEAAAAAATPDAAKGDAAPAATIAAPAPKADAPAAATKPAAAAPAKKSGGGFFCCGSADNYKE